MKLTKAERNILKMLSDGVFNSEEIAKQLDLHRTYVLRITKRLALQGLIDRTMELPTYTTSEAGKKLIAELTKETP